MMTDISGKLNMRNLFELNAVHKWVKPINLNDGIRMDDFNRRDYFKLVAEIVPDQDQKNEKKQRNTLIKFDPRISKEEYSRKTEWIYIFTINNEIVKIGGTRNGIRDRCGSYLCGHHVKERGNSGKCSVTNAFIYNTFEFYLALECKIEMYGYELPQTKIEVNVFGTPEYAIAQTFHIYEARFLQDYKKTYGKFPVLSDNADPEYRS